MSNAYDKNGTKLLNPDGTFRLPKTFARSGRKISRNDLCPCRSGKKFKKCCIDKHLF